MNYRACFALVSVAACGGPDALAPCGEVGLQLIESPATPEEERYNMVLARLQGNLQAAVGQYIDGSLPVYRGALRVVEEHRSVGYAERLTRTGGMAYGVLVDKQEDVDAPGEWVALRELRFYLPRDGHEGKVIQDPRPPARTLQFNGAMWSACQGSATSFVGAPEGIVLTDIVCDRGDEWASYHLEIEGAFERIDPDSIDYEDLLRLRKLRVDDGHFPAFGQEVPETGVLVKVDGDTQIESSAESCHTEIDYSAVSFVHTHCLATHGVSELEIGEARRCCCEGHCHPGEYACTVL